jgi:hypothetical protein
MKNILQIFLTALFLLVIKAKVNAQARLGSTISEIREEFSSIKFEEGLTNGCIVWLKFNFENKEISYYFGSNGSCVLTTITPQSQGTYNAMVEKFNRQYVILSESKWRMYSDSEIVDISLVFPNEGKSYFTFKKNNVNLPKCD